MLDDEAATSLPALMSKLVAQQNFSNGRDINTWASRIYRRVANRLYNNNNNNTNVVVTLQDLELSLEPLLQELADVKATPMTINTMPQLTNIQSATPPPTDFATGLFLVVGLVCTLLLSFCWITLSL